jgi:hypothetical protein
LTVDRYDGDWSALGWIHEIVVLEPPLAGPGLSALLRRYPQDRAGSPPGPLLRVTIQ